MSRENPKPLAFTIVVAVYNGAAYLQRCFDSIMRQTIDDYEIIIMDGGSTDGTVDIIQKNSAFIAYWESKKDKGIYDAWNKALAHTKGAWILFLGSDDTLTDRHTLAQVKTFISNSPALPSILYGQVRAVTPESSEIAVLGKPWPLIKRQALQVMSLPHQGVFHHHSLFLKHGVFDSSFRVAGDFDLLLRELTVTDPAYMPIIVSDWQLGGISSSGDVAELVFAEFERARTKNGLHKFPILLHWNRFKMRVRKRVSRLVGGKLEAVLADFYRLLTGRKRLWSGL